MKITANMVTIARIILMPIPAYLLYQGATELLVALALIIILGFTDWLDGRMARKDGPTVLGGLLDPIADKIFIAVCFIPFAERTLPGWDRTVFPLWMLIVMLSRDFLVTSLRTSLSMRDAPMRTSLLAKFKTAIQMAAVGYLIVVVVAQLVNPESHVIVCIMGSAACIPIGYMIYKLVTGGKPGRRSITMASLTAGYTAVYYFLGANFSIWVLVVVITGLTVVSGFSYLIDTWSAIKGQPGGAREAGRFVLEGVLMPTAFLLPLGYVDSLWISGLIMLGITLELATGGLGNLVASKKVQLRFRWMAIKSILEVLFAGGAAAIFHFQLFPGTHAGEICIALATGVALVYTVISFTRHKAIYMDQL